MELTDKRQPMVCTVCGGSRVHLTDIEVGESRPDHDHGVFVRFGMNAGVLKTTSVYVPPDHRGPVSRTVRLVFRCEDCGIRPGNSGGPADILEITEDIPLFPGQKFGGAGLGDLRAAEASFYHSDDYQAEPV